MFKRLNDRIMASSYMIKYLEIVKSGSSGWVLFKMLTLWKGSLYKLVWIDLLMYIGLYYILNLTYRFGMNGDQKKVFENLVSYCDNAKNSIQISFLLGFFVSGVISRWYQMFVFIPWLNKISFTVMSCFPNKPTSDGASSISSNSRSQHQGGIANIENDMVKQVRVTILRYVNLSWILAMRQISDQIEIRFSRHLPVKPVPKPKDLNSNPTVTEEHEPLNKNSKQDVELGSAVLEEDSGRPTVRDILKSFNDDPMVKSTFKILVTDAEIKAFEKIAQDSFVKTRIPYTPEYWIPMSWAVRLVQKASLLNMVPDPKIAFAIIDEISKVRQQLQDLQIFSSIMIPLVYTQVVIIATYSYFLCQIFASQFTEPRASQDFYFPLISVFSFLFYMGWLKVVMCVMNPFGEDDEDFQTSVILNYNLLTSYKCVMNEENTFPRGLTPASTDSPAVPGSEAENLGNFLRNIQQEMNQVVVPNPMDDINNLHFSPSMSTRCYDCFHRQD